MRCAMSMDGMNKALCGRVQGDAIRGVLSIRGTLLDTTIVQHDIEGHCVESRWPFWRRICTEERTSSIKVCAFTSFMLSQSVAFQCTPSYPLLSSQLLVTRITLLQNTLCNPVLDFSLPIQLRNSTTCRHSYRGRGRPWLILAAPEEARRFAA